MATLDAATRERVAMMLVLVRRMSLVFDTAIDRAGLGELRQNAEVRVCLALYRDGALRPRDLQQAAGLTSGGLTKLLDRLESAGLAHRGARGDCRDGRAVEVELTDAGRAAMGRFIEVVDDAHDDVRPIAKEIVQLAEACGGGPSAGLEPCGELIACVARLGTTLRESAAGEAGSPTAIEFSSLIVLCHAELEGGCRPGSVMELLELSSGGATKLLDRLEASGLVRREYGAVDGDRRAVVVTATPTGRRLMGHALARVATHLDELWLVNHWLAEGVSTRP